MLQQARDGSIWKVFTAQTKGPEFKSPTSMQKPGATGFSHSTWGAESGRALNLIAYSPSPTGELQVSIGWKVTKENVQY